MEPLDIITQAYDKDFRWWFLALLVAVMGFGLWAFRYLLKRSEVEQKSHETHVAALVKELSDSRENHHAKMDAMQARAFEIVREVAGVISACNKLIEANTRESEKVRQVVERIGWEREQNK